ncbi:MAG: DNA polymerase III subunit beta [Patescibacteria group bacterium]
MKIEILKENLERAVSNASRVSNKNLSLPVLGCILMVVEKNRVVLRATNLDVSVEVTLKAKVLDEGVVAIPAHTLTQTVSALTDQKLTLEAPGNTLTITGPRGKASITTVDPSEFPKLPYVKEGSGVSVTLPSRDFSAALRSVSFAAATTSMKPELASVALTLERGELVAAATDSFRLAEIRMPAKTKGSFETVLIPARNVPDILRAADESEETEVRVGENQCSFVTESGYLTSRTIDGAFPDYKAIIPRDSMASATCLKDDALRAFRKVSIFVDSYNQVHLSLKPSEKTFTVHAVNASVGEADDHIPATIDGEDIDINFNARYIADALAVMGGTSIAFSVAGPGKPMLITDAPHKNFTYLVMPMNR